MSSEIPSKDDIKILDLYAPTTDSTWNFKASSSSAVNVVKRFETMYNGTYSSHRAKSVRIIIRTLLSLSTQCFWLSISLATSEADKSGEHKTVRRPQENKYLCH